MSTSGRGIDTRDFTKGRGDTDDDCRDQEPAPDDVDGPAPDEGVVEGGGETVGNGGQDKGHEGHLQRGAGARQLRLVAEVLEELVGSVILARREPMGRLRELGVSAGAAGGAERAVVEVGDTHGGGTRGTERRASSPSTGEGEKSERQDAEAYFYPADDGGEG